MVLEIRVNAMRQFLRRFEQRPLWAECLSCIVLQLRQCGNVRWAVDELRSLDALCAGLSGGLVASFFPRKRWKFSCVRLHVNRTLCRRFKPIVSFEDFERCDVVAVVILPVMDEGRFRIHMYGSFMDLLDRKHSRRKPKLVETMRNRSFVDVTRRVSYVEEHLLFERDRFPSSRGGDYTCPRTSLILTFTTTTSAGRLSGC